MVSAAAVAAAVAGRYFRARRPPGETTLFTFRLAGTLPAATARELKETLAAAHAAGHDHRHAQKSFFAKFDALLSRMPTGQRYFESEQLAELLADEIMMLEETGFVVYGFSILPNHAHLVLHLPASSWLAFAPAIDLLLPAHRAAVPPPGTPQIAARGALLASRLAQLPRSRRGRSSAYSGLCRRAGATGRASPALSGVALCKIVSE